MNNSPQIVASNTKAEGDLLRLIKRVVEQAIKEQYTFNYDNDKLLCTLCSDFKNYLNDFGYSSKYQSSVKATLNKAEFLFGPEKKIHEITSKEIEEFIQFCRRKAPAGYKVDFRNLRTLFSKAISWNLIKENPCKLVKLPKEQQQRREYLTLSELQTVLTFTRLQVLKDIYLFAFQTALRLSELLNLRWSDVSINDGIITVGSESFRTKSRKIRTIPLSSEAIEILKRRFPKYINPVDDFVFTKKEGKQYSANFVSKNFKRALRRAGISENVCFHSLRHSSISHALNNGAPLSAVKDFAGHSSIQTTQNYLHTNMDDLRKVSQTFNKASQTFNIAVGDK